MSWRIEWRKKWYWRTLRRGAISFVLILIADTMIAVETGDFLMGYKNIIIPLLFMADKAIRDHANFEYKGVNK